MYATHSKMPATTIIVILALFSIAFTGCGDSQGVTTLNAHLSEFSELIENYKSTVAGDQTKQPALDERIAAMSAKWTNIRNELGSDITPQKMDELVEKYDNLMLTLTNFKKTIGS